MKKVFIALFLICLFNQPNSYAEMKMVGSSPPTFFSGISTQTLEFSSQPSSLGKQRRTNWCWAASIQMVLNYYDIPVSQEQVVSQMFGGYLPNATASSQQVLQAVNGWGITVYGQPKIIRAMNIANLSVNRKNKIIIDSLREDKPLIIGLAPRSGQTGHAYVLTAIKYYFPSKNSPEYNNKKAVVDKVVLRDPWPLSPSKITMSGKEFFQRAFLCAKISVD